MTRSGSKRDKAVPAVLAEAPNAELELAIQRGIEAQKELEQRRLRNRRAREAYEDARSRRGLITILTAWRKHLGISQSELARRTGTRQSAISEIEQGQGDFLMSTVQRIARGLELGLEWRLWSETWSISFSYSGRALQYESSVEPIRTASPGDHLKCGAEHNLYVLFVKPEDRFKLRQRKSELEQHQPSVSPVVAQREVEEEPYLVMRIVRRLASAQAATNQARDEE